MPKDLRRVERIAAKRIKPLGRKIVVFPPIDAPKEEVSKGGIVLPEKKVYEDEDGNIIVPNLRRPDVRFAEVAAVGTDVAECRPGQWVLMSIFAGARFVWGGREMAIIKSSEIIAVFDGDPREGNPEAHFEFPEN